MEIKLQDITAKDQPNFLANFAHLFLQQFYQGEKLKDKVILDNVLSRYTLNKDLYSLNSFLYSIGDIVYTRDHKKVNNFASVFCLS